MWTPGEGSMLFDIVSELEQPFNSQIYDNTNKFIDLQSWRNEYAKFYKEWLEFDDDSIYNLNSNFFSDTLKKLSELNSYLKEMSVYLWFDIDRTWIDQFIWEKCPISGKHLLNLGTEFPEINRLVSPDYPLILPSYESV